MRTLLIADDERTIREGIAASVDWEAIGVSRVLLAADGREAFELIVKERPDIALVDIIMPEMTGIELITHFKREGCDTEFVIISGYGEFDYAQEAIRNNVNNYILKPCDIGEISGTIEGLVSKLERKAEAEREREQLKERISLLLPQAREQLFREFITSASTDGTGFELLREMFKEGGGKFRLLLFTSGDGENYETLRLLKSCAAASPYVKGWRFGAIVRDCVVLVLGEEAGSSPEEVATRLCGEAGGYSVTGIKAAVSDEDEFQRLPEMYRETREAVRFAFLFDDRELVTAREFNRASAVRFSRIVRQVMRYCAENLSDSSLSLNHIASKVLYLNPDYLGKLFKKECGVKFSDYLMSIRIEKAKQLILSSGDLKVYEIAQQVGFGDNAAYFSQIFSKFTNMLPSEYRARH